MNLSVELAPRSKKGLRLKNPVIAASGTFGYGIEDSHLFEVQKLGAVVCKGTTLKPQEGNPQPRVAETECGILNSIGLENIGVESLIRDKAPVWAGLSVPVIVNIAGETVRDYAELARRLDGVAGVSALEVNISCPNVKAGGVEFGSSLEGAQEVTAAVRAATRLPVLVKLTPNTADLVRIALAVEKAGADAITLINTLKGMAIDLARRRPFLGGIFGGLSGPAIKPVALCMVYEVASEVKIPVLGCGGIASARDALEFIMAGASAVQVGSANLSNPRAPLDVLEGMADFMEKEGIEDLAEIIGVARV